MSFGILLQVLYFFIGHILAALIVYFNHRYVFHGRLGKLPVLRQIKLIHARHHAYAYTDDGNDYIITPLWAKTLIVSVVLAAGYVVGWEFAAGLGSFSVAYAYRHWRIHNQDQTSRFSLHHRIHHEVSPRKNFSGVYPIIDKVFGTNF